MVERGDIVWADLGPPAGRRPVGVLTRDAAVAVLTRDAAVAVLTAITCAPITRTIRGIRSEVEVGPAQGLPEQSVISCDNLITIPATLFDAESNQSAISISKPGSGPTKPSAMPLASNTNL
ncbi:MAG: type II toxin-antitoxin system PemK/MazF family toxin [Acidimicrobiales bacterium]